ncbi:MAG: hypothetical protein JSU05_07190, partial [Bacteroidetes bacterium]|nr:hypothetical protein [Bacteroidota bacterium]
MTGRQTLIRSIADFLKQNKQQLTGKKITAGFDGFIDTVARIIKEKSDTALTTVSSAKEFATYIADKSGTNFSLELQEIITKPGGNMPIMANALGKAGVQVNCIGALGLPSIHAQFEQLSSNCTLYSFANPGITTAIEFDDSKMLLAEMTSINNSGWETVKNMIGINKLV